MEKKSSCFGMTFSSIISLIFSICFKAYSTVGTPDYIAPEVFKQCGYNNVRYVLFEDKKRVLFDLESRLVVIRCDYVRNVDWLSTILC